jgi:hypothetical protein
MQVSVAIPVIWVMLISSYLRIRRVKRDEERPYCLRCRTFGVECDGYLYQNKSGQGPTKCLIAPKREIHFLTSSDPNNIRTAPQGFFRERTGISILQCLLSEDRVPSWMEL